jgi:hypothetical protein
MNNNVIEQLAALKTMPVDKLKAKWRELFRNEPPPFNRGYLESRLAYRIQELVYGGLKKETARRIEQLRPDASGRIAYKRDTNLPPIGAILVREHGGVEHRVRVLQDGFDYNGKTFRSLSAVASHITGVHWNGPMFFGLRRKG